MEWCHEAVQGVSRTFALTVEALEEPMASHICVGYLLCRVADTVEDSNTIPAADQARLLRTFHDAVDPSAATTITEFRTAVDPWIPPAADRNDDWAVVAAAPTVLATFRSLPDGVRTAVVSPVLEMVAGMATFVDRYRDEGGLRIQDLPELERYCHYAAGTVGRLVTNLLTRDQIEGERAATLSETAESFGLLLQLVNIAKDVYGDFTTENNVYLPAEWLAAEGVTQEAVLARENRPRVARVVSRTVDHARSFLDDAQRYLEAMPLVHGNTVAAWSVPYLLAVGTLRELSERPEDAVSEAGVKVSREEVFAVMQAARQGGQSAIPELRAAIAADPLQQSFDPTTDAEAEAD
ncbi:MAG: phytoene/squalene synthase family protein [Halorhabdus sp.]